MASATERSGGPEQRDPDAIEPVSVIARPLAPPWLDLALRVRLFVILLTAISVLGYVFIVRQLPTVAAPFLIPWPLAALAFYLGEVNVVVVHFLRERHSFSLSELPGVVGLFLLTPTDYVLAYLIGAGAALLVDRRQPGVKQAFNLAQFGISAVVAQAVFHLIAEGGPGQPGPRDWVAAFVSSGATAALGALLVASVISLSGGAPQFKKLPEMVRFSGMVAMANTSLALLAVMVVWVDPRSAVLLAVPTAIVFLAYRAYIGEREKHERLELLYESSRILHYAPELDSAISALLDHARRMFRAERAELLLFPDPAGDGALRSTAGGLDADENMTPVIVPVDDVLRARVRHEQEAFNATPTPAWTTHVDGIKEAMVGPLVGERGVLGALTIVNRLGEGSRFEADDLRLLETVANQAAVALENGQLEQSLHELSRLKEQLRHQAYHDSLTGLANRALFVEEVERRLADPGPGAPTTVVFLDLDDFKIVNDTLGHAEGDRLLIGVAERIGSELRGDDLLARFGGDEFAILPSAGSSVDDALALSERIIAALELPFPIAGTDVIVGCSAGISAARGNDRVDELLRDADVAMYRAKEYGKRRAEVFDPTMHSSIVERHALTSDLGRSISRGDLSVAYQPIVALATGRITGVEALVRWRHPTRGVVDPTEFIRLAEENGTIVALGRAVLREATRQVVEWHQQPGLKGLTLSVNLSPLQLQHPGFIDEVRADIRDSGIDPRDLTFEMTETAMFRDIGATIATLESIRELGVRIAMDDFGTGYSSLAYLRRFPVDILKIARELIGPSETDDQEAWAFARAVVALGRSLGLSIVAEGIETEEQLRMLRRLGCGLGQGYLFGRPAPAPDLEPLLTAGMPIQATA